MKYVAPCQNDRYLELYERPRVELIQQTMEAENKSSWFSFFFYDLVSDLGRIERLTRELDTLPLPPKARDITSELRRIGRSIGEQLA